MDQLSDNERKHYLSVLESMKKNIEIMQDELRGKIEPESDNKGNVFRFDANYFERGYASGRWKKPAGLKNKKAMR